MNSETPPTSLPGLDPFIEAVTGRKAYDLVVLDVRELTTVADAFIICSGKSNRQVAAISEHAKRELKKQGIKALFVEGSSEGHWYLLDYGDVVIHVFYDPTRRFYDLEGLWADAPRIVTPLMEKLAARATEEDEDED